MLDCLFCKIVAKTIPSSFVYEDENIYAFLDTKPVNPGHVLVIPKKHFEGFQDADETSLKQLILVTQKIARALILSGICIAFNLQENNGVIAGQVIPHLHLHIVPRQPDDGLKHWPGTLYAAGEADKIAERIRLSIG